MNFYLRQCRKLTLSTNSNGLTNLSNNLTNTTQQRIYNKSEPKTSNGCTFCSQIRFYSKENYPKMGIKNKIKSVLQELGIFFEDNYTSFQLNKCAERLLNNIYTEVDYSFLMKYGGLNDTFYDWARVAALHAWLLDVRLLSESRDGEIIVGRLMSAMYRDWYRRLKIIQSETKFRMKTNEVTQNLIHAIQESIVYYDYGLQNDSNLAEVVWINLYGSKDINNPILLENWIIYIRSNLQHLNSIGMNDIVHKPESIAWKTPYEMQMPS